MRAAIRFAALFCALFWWGVFTNTLTTFAAYAIAVAVVILATRVGLTLARAWPLIAACRARRRVRRDFPRASADWGN